MSWLLTEKARDVKLTKADIEYFKETMANGTVFKEWLRDSNPDFNTLAKCFKYELARGRVRSDIFRSIIQRYNSLLMDMNRSTAFGALDAK